MNTTTLSGKKILVTGATGFIGMHLCNHLRNLDVEIHAVSRGYNPNIKAGVRSWSGDLSQAVTAKRLVKAIQPDIIFHLAGFPFGSHDLALIRPTFRSNLMTTVNVLQAASECQCQRVLLGGSMEEPDGQNTYAIPSSPYAAAKWAGSMYARMFHMLYQLPVVILRIFLVYGPGERHMKKLIPYAISSFSKGKPPKLASGERKVDWVYVEDVAECFIRASAVSGIDGATLDVGSGKLHTIGSVIEKLNRMIDPNVQPLFGMLPDREQEPELAADTAKTLRAVGWQPETSLDQGLKRTVDWYKQQRKWSERSLSTV